MKRAIFESAFLCPRSKQKGNKNPICQVLTSNKNDHSMTNGECQCVDTDLNCCLICSSASIATSSLFVPKVEECNLISKTLDKMRQGSFEIGHEDLTIGQEIGKGAFGVVKKGSWRGKPCVAKMLTDDADKFKMGHKCLLSEMSILSDIGAHPNLVSFFGACIHDIDSPIIVQELIEGPNLHDYLKAKSFQFNLGAAKVS